MSTIKTGILIVSDTHGMEFKDTLLKTADIAIHCGDLTDGSKLEEIRAGIRLMENMNAPLKLIIAGNHDFTLDIPAFERKVAEAAPSLDFDLVAKEYGMYGEARQLLENARNKGIFFLDEGTYKFILDNGALLKVYASPWTPALGAWGFQYPPSSGHEFAIENGTDIVITHGPPKGIMDFTHARERSGCSDLFRAVARARPAIHCFGHIHEGWGAKLVSWRPEIDDLEERNHFNAIDNEQSVVIENLAGLKASRFDTPDDVQKKALKLERYNEQKYCATSHCTGDKHRLKSGEHTLFVNAAIEGDDGQLSQKPFFVELELTSAQIC